MRKIFALTLAVLMLAAMLTACNGNQNSADENTIKIGLTGPMTGGAAVYGTAVRAGMEIAVEEINAAAGENGLKIEFKSADDEHDPEKALNAYNSLKDWGMQIFAGAVTTGPSLTLAPEAVSDQIFMLTPSASSVDVPKAGDNVFQMCFTDPNQGANAAKLVSEKKLGTKIGIIYNSSDDYSTGLVKGFETEAGKLNLDIVEKQAFTDSTKSDLTTQVQKCKDAGCDLVFLPFYAQEATQVLNYAATINYKPTFFGCDGMDGILTIDGFNAANAEGLVMMTPFNADSTDAKVQNFVAKYKAKMNGTVPNQFAADGYDVIYSIYQGCIDKGINGKTSAADACAKLTEYFGSVSFNGLTGSNLTWDAQGTVSKNPEAVKIQNGKYVNLD